MFNGLKPVCILVLRALPVFGTSIWTEIKTQQFGKWCNFEIFPFRNILLQPTGNAILHFLRLLTKWNSHKLDRFQVEACKYFAFLENRVHKTQMSKHTDSNSYVVSTSSNYPSIFSPETIMELGEKGVKGIVKQHCRARAALQNT